MSTLPLTIAFSHSLYLLMAQIFTDWAPTTRHSAGHWGSEGGNLYPLRCVGFPIISSNQLGDYFQAVTSLPVSSDNVCDHPFLSPEQLLSSLFLTSTSLINGSQPERTKANYWVFHFHFWSYCPNLYFILCWCLRINLG